MTCMFYGRAVRRSDRQPRDPTDCLLSLRRLSRESARPVRYCTALHSTVQTVHARRCQIVVGTMRDS